MSSKKKYSQKTSNTIASVKPISASEKINSTSFLNEERISWILLAFIMILVVIIRSKFYQMPFERDEGAYSYYGKLLLEGKIPYKDFYEQKFPGIFYFYATIVMLFGDTVKGMHMGFMILNLATIFVLFLTARKLFSSFAGVVTAACYAFISLAPSLSGFTVQSEHGVAFFASLGIYLYTLYIEKDKWWMQLLMGLAMGTSFMVKTSGMFFVAWGGVMLIIHFLFSSEKNFKKFIFSFLFYGLGVSFVILLLFLIISLKGVFSDMIFWSYTIPKAYVGKIPFSDGVKYFGYTKDALFQTHSFFWYHALIALALCFLKSIKWEIKIAFITLFSFSFMTIVPGFYFYGHYWIQLLPCIALLSGITFYTIISLIKNRFKVKSLIPQYIYLALFSLFVYNHASQLKAYYFKPNFDLIQRNVYGNNPFPETMEIANYINTHSKPEDQIIAMGSEPEIYFYTKKTCPTRHAYFASVVNNVPQHHQWQREFASDVEKAKPRYFIFYNHGISLFVQPNTDKYIFEWANKFITENYKIIGVVDMIEGQRSVYVWNEALNTYKPVSKTLIYIYERK